MTESPLRNTPRLGILAGGGSVPDEIAAAAQARGWPVHVVAIDGEADGAFPGIDVTRVNWGQIGGMLRAFRAAGSTHLLIIGRVNRPDMTRLKPDFGLVRAIPTILRIMSSGGDDGVLRGVVRFFEQHGLTVIGPLAVAPALALEAGALTSRSPGSQDSDDIKLGLEIVRLLGPFDVGQSVAVRGGKILAIEGAEGTDRMLARVTGLDAQRDGVLVKRPKPQQDMRVDVPVIGPDTVSNAARSGLAGIAVHAGAVMLTQREELLRRANELGVFVYGVSDAAVTGVEKRLVRGQQADEEDIARGAEILRILKPYGCCRAVVVARKYVLAVDSGEGADAILTRAGGLRQWGNHRTKKRVGVAVLAQDEVLGTRQVDLAAEAGLRGIAMRAARPPDFSGIETYARDKGLFIRFDGDKEGMSA